MLSSNLIVSIVGGIAIVGLIAWIIRLEMRIKKLFVGTDAKSLEGALTKIADDIEAYKKWRDENDAYLSMIEAKLKKSIRAVHTVRFNPFKGTGSGGDQSFATAFLNEEGQGVVVSSLYSRERVSVFAKPIDNHASLYELSAEEKDALLGAKTLIS